MNAHTYSIKEVRAEPLFGVRGGVRHQIIKDGLPTSWPRHSRAAAEAAIRDMQDEARGVTRIAVGGAR